MLKNTDSLCTRGAYINVGGTETIQKTRKVFDVLSTMQRIKMDRCEKADRKGV